VENATHYLFSLFHNVKTPVTQTEDFTEDFSSLSDGTLPEGWTYTPGTSGAAPELYVNEEGGVKSAIKIKNGDTLSEIAARNHTTVKKLRRLNGIKGNNIRAGKKIKVR